MACLRRGIVTLVANVSSNGLPVNRHSHTCCMCLTLLHCVFSNASSNRLHDRMHNHTDCICVTFLRCVLSNVSSNCLHERMHSHIGCTCLTYLHCVVDLLPPFSILVQTLLLLRVNKVKVKVQTRHVSFDWKISNN